MMDLTRLKYLQKNPIFILLFINSLLVILGYATARVLGSGAFGQLKLFRTILLFGSLVYVFKLNGPFCKNLLNSSAIYTLLICIIFFALLRGDDIGDLYRSTTFIIPFLYVLYTINYLLNFGAFNLLVVFSWITMIIYVLVPISFFLFGGDLTETLIYGKKDSEAFVSNHYGWSSTVYILSSLTVLKYYPLKRLLKYAILVFLPISFYLLIISANRSGILALVLAFIFFIFKDRHVNLGTKIMIIIIPILTIVYLANQEYSAIDFLMEKNEAQIESGKEGRFEAASDMINEFEENPVLWFTGVGMFNYEILVEKGGILRGYHNSYFEILFGAGFLLFIIFLIFMLFWPLIVFWKVTNNYSLLIFPLILIPFFEMDLTAGQFLFFPWFSYILVLNAKELHPLLYKSYNIL
ncbi:O-antigen ligase family protein [Lutimonas zeaxanthinifaciens]|uniref:O-antigen ligase family protein n=1 Tax=Lutimonas zeaxanthinifaciens TaxID=3060215 RepID=UPI00265D37AD|nr:O-antigen ligase family protein [Lutimonas sp. YSD2104]WKK67362.1 O-antigen ligase family protein [Lutimonas sp. YSD2104]